MISHHIAQLESFYGHVIILRIQNTVIKIATTCQQMTAVEGNFGRLYIHALILLTGF